MTKTKNTPTASRVSAIQPFHVMALLARAKELESLGRDIVHMEVGEPDFCTPAPIIDAAYSALKSGKTHYTPATGLPELKSTIAEFYRTQFSVEIEPRCIVVTPGASGALLLLIGLLIERDRNVLMADPGYPCNRNFVRFVEAQAKLVNVSADSDYQLTAQLVRQHWDDQTAAVLIASPSNPTGTVAGLDAMQSIAEFVREREGALLVDEIYQNLVYHSKPTTVLSVAPDAFVINSFSKYFHMTGWRLGWIVAPEQYIDPLDRLAQNLFLSAPSIAQHAALAAFTPECMQVFEERRVEFNRRRDFLLPALREIGFKIPIEPSGAFYLYADCSRFSNDSFAFCHRLLEDIGVAVTPGVDFGEFHASTHVRFAYTTSIEQLQKGVTRLAELLC